MKKRILELLTIINPVADYESSLDFIEDGLLDSFDVINLVVAIDEQMGISIPGIDILPDNFKNLAAINNMLKRLSNEI
jgi:acyl carrier protein